MPLPDDAAFQAAKKMFAEQDQRVAKDILARTPERWEMFRKVYGFSDEHFTSWKHDQLVWARSQLKK